MKAALLALFLICATAHAATLTELRPAGPTTGASRWQCAATGFSDAGITGACMERHYGICSGRGCVPRITVLGTWVTTWDTDGNPTLSTTSAAWPGCQGTSDVVIVNQSPYYYISADSTGRELVENNCVSYFWQP